MLPVAGSWYSRIYAAGNAACKGNISRETLHGLSINVYLKNIFITGKGLNHSVATVTVFASHVNTWHGGICPHVFIDVL